MLASKLVLPTVATLLLGASSGVAPTPETDAIDRAYEAALGRARRGAISGELRLPPATWEEPRVGRSANYEVRTTQGRGYAVGRAKDLEAMLSLYQDVLGTDFVPTTRFSVLIHPTPELYSTYGAANSDQRSSIFGGYYDQGNPSQAIATVYDPNLGLERMYLTQAACQQFMARAFPRSTPPPFLTQGLSAYFQSSWNYSYFVDRFEALRDGAEGNGLFPLEELLNAPLAAYTERPRDRFFQLAMVYVYLRMVRQDTRSEFEDGRITTAGPFDEYLRLIARGMPVEDHAVHELLTEGVDVLDEEMRAFENWR